jgi:hypothetical protein
MRKKIIFILTVITGLSFLIEILNDFQDLRSFLAVFHHEKYYVKEKLIVKSFEEYSNKGSNKIIYVIGKTSKNQDAFLALRREILNNLEKIDTVDIWYSEFTKTSFLRSLDNFDVKPISFRLGYSFIEMPSTYSFFLFLFWYLALQFPHRKKLFYGIIVGYFLLFIYGCITDFEFIKSHMDCFQNQKN